MPADREPSPPPSRTMADHQAFWLALPVLLFLFLTMGYTVVLLVGLLLK